MEGGGDEVGRGRGDGVAGAVGNDCKLTGWPASVDGTRGMSMARVLGETGGVLLSSRTMCSSMRTPKGGRAAKFSPGV